MKHILIDSCIYRADQKRSKPAFKAIARLGQARKLQLHIPAFVKGEVLTKREEEVKEQMRMVRSAARGIERVTDEEQLNADANTLHQIASRLKEQTYGLLKAEFESWCKDVGAAEHAVHPEHGARVAEAYFTGATPFRQKKHRPDIPDAFIWESALDLVKEHGALVVISADGRMHQAAVKHPNMEGFKSLDEFINAQWSQEALAALITERVAQKLDRIKRILPDLEFEIINLLGPEIVDELAARSVRDESIPDDNNEATIVSVWEPENVTFNFIEVDFYGGASLGVPFTTEIACSLSYSLFKGDYYSLPEERDISVSELNDHYFEAEEEYTISAEGVITLLMDADELEDGDAVVSDKDLKESVTSARVSVTLSKVAVIHPNSRLERMYE